MNDGRVGSQNTLVMEDANSRRINDVVQPKCPLCGTTDTRLDTRIETDSIVALYEKSLQGLARRELQGTAWIYVYRCPRCLLCFFEPKVAASPDFYAVMQSREGYYLQDKTEYEMAVKWIAPGARVLEVGCGVGYFAKRLSECNYTGLEYSEVAVTAARISGLDVRVQSVQDHATAYPEAYDVVCAFQVLEHVPDPADFIAACLECVRPGGILLYGIPSDDSYLQFFQNTSTNVPPHHLTRWRDKTLEAVADIFPVIRIAIEHEQVTDPQVRDCANAMIRRRLNALLNRRTSMVDRSIGGRILGRCSAFLAGRLLVLFRDAEFRPRGHTVVAVFQKLQLATRPNSNGAL